MGCGSSKQSVVEPTIRYRHFLRKGRSQPGNSRLKSDISFMDVAAKTSEAPVTLKPSVGEALSDIEEVTLEEDVVEVTVASAGKQTEQDGPVPPIKPPGECDTARLAGEESEGDASSNGDDHEVKSNEEGGAGSTSSEEGARTKTLESEEVEKMRCYDSAPEAYQVDVASDREDSTSSEDDKAQVELQLAEQLASFRVWCPEGHGDGAKDCDAEEVLKEEEFQDRQVGLSPHISLEPGSELIEKPFLEGVEEDEEQFGDAAEAFKEDFSKKIPVYDEYPLDQLLQAPDTGCGHISTEQVHVITSYLPCAVNELYQKLIEARRSRPDNGSKGKKVRTHYQLHQKQIQKQTRRRRSVYQVGRRRSKNCLSAGAAEEQRVQELELPYKES